MTPRPACIAALIVAGVAAGARTAEAQAPVFRAGADVVTVDVSVRRERRPVTGLKASDFELLDNGVPQAISDASYEKLPVDLTFLLDISASVTGPVLEELGRALQQVRGDLAKGDRLRLVTFNMGVRRLVDFAEAPARVDDVLASARGAGSSAIFDALAVALASGAEPGRRSLIVLFSDGQDSSSIIDADTLVALARRSTPTIAVILASSAPDRPASLLRSNGPLSTATVGGFAERLAGETGGVVATARPGENLAGHFRRMLQEFRASYVLYFTPQRVDPAGAHTLEVRVRRPEVEVRARKGYVWR